MCNCENNSETLELNVLLLSNLWDTVVNELILSFYVIIKDGRNLYHDIKNQ